jgi:hypothetical protein
MRNYIYFFAFCCILKWNAHLPLNIETEFVTLNKNSINHIPVMAEEILLVESWYCLCKFLKLAFRLAINLPVVYMARDVMILRSLPFQDPKKLYL